MNDNFCCMPPKIDSETLLTQDTYKECFYRIERIALNVTRWDNLPKEVNQMMLERFLFYYGRCAFFYDDILEKYLVLPVSAEYAWDEYGFPTEYEVMGFLGYTRRLNSENSVLILNNYQFHSDTYQASLFATRLCETKRTVDMHTEALRLGIGIAVPENKKTSAQKLVAKLKNFQLWHIISPGFLEGSDKIKTFDLQRRYDIDKLDVHLEKLWAEVYDFFGVDNAPEKRERLISDEVFVQTSVSEINRNARLNPRQDACEKINKMFGLDVMVTANRNSIYGNGGDGDGELHNDIENAYGKSDKQDGADNV